jgi:hypothetical protein
MPHARHPHSPDEGGDPSAPEPRHAGLLGPSRERLEAAICETVFRYQLQQPLMDTPQPPRYYLALRGRDPDEALLRRLRDLPLTIQPLSHCRVTAREGVRDRTAGAHGVILQVVRVAWVHAAAVEVVGGYYITHRHAASFQYGVEFQGTHWAVTTVHLLWRV